MRPGVRAISPPVFYIRSTNTTLRKCLLGRYPVICQQTNASQEAGCMEFDIEKGRFSFRLTAPYSERCRRAANEAAKAAASNLTQSMVYFFEKILSLMYFFC